MRRRRIVDPSPDIRESTTRLLRWRQKEQRMIRAYRESALRSIATPQPPAGAGIVLRAGESSAHRHRVERTKLKHYGRGTPRPDIVCGIVRGKRRRSALVRLDICNDVLDRADLLGVL